ncbi:MAG: hypothetical protein JOZ73_03350 [Solirubrobacterales bacterium]|nr:hypothetical protein [Solirubrobacterales bacterium]
MTGLVPDEVPEPELVWLPESELVELPESEVVGLEVVEVEGVDCVCVVVVELLAIAGSWPATSCTNNITQTAMKIETATPATHLRIWTTWRLRAARR